MSIIIFAPHPDDELLGCGGLILKSIRDRRNLKIVYVTSGGKREKKLREKAVSKVLIPLGLRNTDLIFLRNEELFQGTKQAKKIFRQMTKIIDEVKPDEIYAPAYEGGHIDHDIINFFTANVNTHTLVFEYPIYGSLKPKDFCLKGILSLFNKLSGKYLLGYHVGFTKIKDASPFYLRMSKSDIISKNKMIKLYRVLTGEKKMERLPRYGRDLFRRLPNYNYFRKPHRGCLGYEFTFNIPFTCFKAIVGDFYKSNER